MTEEMNSPTNDQARSGASRPLYRDPEAPLPARVADLLSRMTLVEKIGQMTLVEKNSITPEAVRGRFVGAVLSGGGGYPAENSPAGWQEMVNSFKEAALGTRLGIPLLYGVDAVHGHGNMRGAVIFPHNIGLGATRDPDLVRRIGRATAEEMAAAGTRWNYAPAVSVARDYRWGRTFEGFGEDPALVGELAAAYIRGLHGQEIASPTSVLGTPKHFVGDGATAWGTSTTTHPPVPASGIDRPTPFIIDQGDARIAEATLRAEHLPPYIEAIEAGALVIMASFSSWNGNKVHAHGYLLTEVLKGELGFDGFVVSDWGGIDQVAADYDEAVASCINAGIDMNMVPFDYERFITTLKGLVEGGRVPLERIDEAVGRVLSVKFRAGLFERPLADPRHQSLAGGEKHRALAREAAAKSLVLLKNEAGALPLSRSTPLIFVAGRAADDIGLQCGGWTIEWQGKPGPITPGVTILEALRETVSAETVVEYDPAGDFSRVAGADGRPAMAEVGLAVVGESPYAEGFGDWPDLSLSEGDVALLERLRRRCKRLVVVLISGRPLILSEQLPLMDALTAAWWPGSEGGGVVDVLFGEVPFTGKLPYRWPQDMNQIPINPAGPDQEAAEPLFPFGFGLS